MPELLELTALPDKLREAAELPSVRLTSRQLCDYEMLASGAFAPLDRFMGAEDHGRVVEEMRLANGSWTRLSRYASNAIRRGYTPGPEAANYPI